MSNRFADIEAVVMSLSPISGLSDGPLVPIEAAVRRAWAADPLCKGHNPATYLQAAKQFVATNIDLDDPAEPLNLDDVRAIHLYTQEGPIYKIVNLRLRDTDRGKLAPWAAFLRRLLNALLKLPAPAKKRLLYRGVRRPMAKLFGNLQPAATDTFSLGFDEQAIVGEEFTWWALAVAHENVKAVQKYLGPKGDRVLVNVLSSRCRNVSRYSSKGGAKEWLLLPGTVLIVTAVMAAGDFGMMVVRAEEQELSMIADMDELAALAAGDKGSSTAADADGEQSTSASFLLHNASPSGSFDQSLERPQGGRQRGKSFTGVPLPVNPGAPRRHSSGATLKSISVARRQNLNSKNPIMQAWARSAHLSANSVITMTAASQATYFTGICPLAAVDVEKVLARVACGEEDFAPNFIMSTDGALCIFCHRLPHDHSHRGPPLPPAGFPRTIVTPNQCCGGTSTEDAVTSAPAPHLCVMTWTENRPHGLWLLVASAVLVVVGVALGLAAALAFAPGAGGVTAACFTPAIVGAVLAPVGLMLFRKRFTHRRLSIDNDSKAVAFSERRQEAERAVWTCGLHDLDVFVEPDGEPCTAEWSSRHGEYYKGVWLKQALTFDVRERRTFDDFFLLEYVTAIAPEECMEKHSLARAAWVRYFAEVRTAGKFPAAGALARARAAAAACAGSAAAVPARADAAANPMSVAPTGAGHTEVTVTDGGGGGGGGGRRGRASSIAEVSSSSDDEPTGRGRSEFHDDEDDDGGLDQTVGGGADQIRALSPGWHLDSDEDDEADGGDLGAFGDLLASVANFDRVATAQQGATRSTGGAGKPGGMTNMLEQRRAETKQRADARRRQSRADSDDDIPDFE
jgi:hypothetical protein